MTPVLLGLPLLSILLCFLVIRLGVKDAPDAVAHKVFDDAIAMAFGVFLNRRADIAQARPGADLLYPDAQTLFGDLDALACLFRPLAHEERA